MIGDPHEDFDLAQLVAALPEQYGNMSFQVSKGKGYKIRYRTRAIITRGLYLFYPIFHCGLYLRAVYTAARSVFH